MSSLPNKISTAHDSTRIVGHGEFRIKYGEDEKSKISPKRIRVNKSLKPIDEKFIDNSNKKTTKTINELSPEVFQLIMASFIKLFNWSKIIPLRLVCKHWMSNIDSYLSSRQCFIYMGCVTKGNPPPGMNYYEFFAMTTFYPNMRQLFVKNYTVSDYLVTIISKNCPKIERINIFGCRGLTWKGITILTLKFSSLTYIDISNCELDEHRLSILIKGLQKVKTINAINPGKKVSGKCLNKLGHEIENIYIGLNHLSDANPALEALISGNGKNLIHFGLIVCDIQKTNLNLTTNSLKKLKSLKLTFESYGFGKLNFIGKLKDLEYLFLVEDSKNENDSVLNDYSLQSIIRGCLKLKSLSIAGTKSNTCRFTHSSISQIPIYCKQMEQIRFINGNNVLDQTLIDLADLKCLQVLHLNSMARVSDIGIINFVKKAQKSVRNFRVTDSPKITENIIEPWIEVANQRSSETIKLYLEGVMIKRSLDGLPSNLKITVTQK